MFKQNVGLKCVLFFISCMTLLSPVYAESNFESGSNSKHVVKIISQDLWNSGVVKEGKQKILRMRKEGT